MEELAFRKAMQAADEADAARPVAPPTESELVNDVARAALEVRSMRKRLEGFQAGISTYSRAIAVPLAVFDAAVERLAAFRGCQ